MVTYNEADRVGDALRSVEWADERVVVDSFSSDGTPEVCLRWGAQVLQRAWSGYADQKQFAVAQTRHDWVLLLDADERVSPELREELLAWREGPPADQVGYYVPRRTCFLGRWIRHAWWPDHQLRLFLKTSARWAPRRVHESLLVTGPAGVLRGPLHHHTYRNLEEYVARMNRYGELAALDYQDAGRRFRWWDLVLAPPATFLKYYVLKQGFRDGYPGFILSALSGFSAFVKYAKLRELEQRGGGVPSPEAPETSQTPPL